MTARARLYFIESDEASECHLQMALVGKVIEAGFTLVGLYNETSPEKPKPTALFNLIDDLKPGEWIILKNVEAVEYLSSQAIKALIETTEQRQATLWIFDELPFEDITPPFSAEHVDYAFVKNMTNVYIRNLMQEIKLRRKETQLEKKTNRTGIGGRPKDFNKILAALKYMQDGKTQEEAAKRAGCAPRTVSTYYRDFISSRYETPRQYVAALRKTKAPTLKEAQCPMKN